MLKSTFMAKQVPNSDLSSPSQINIGTKIEGIFKSDGNLRIDGDLKGRIEIKGKVVIGANSIIEGDVYCGSADVLGKITGNLVVKEKTLLKASAVLNGDLYTGSLSVETGALFNGKCKMGITENEFLTINYSEKVLVAEE